MGVGLRIRLRNRIRKRGRLRIAEISKEHSPFAGWLSSRGVHSGTIDDVVNLNGNKTLVEAVD